MRIYISKKADIKFNIPVYEGKVRRFLESLIAVLCVIAVILLGVCIRLSSQFVSYTLEAGDTVSASDIVGDPDARFGDGFSYEYFNKAGIYRFTVLSGGREVSVRLRVNDTQAPKITTKEVFFAVGGPLPVPEDFIDTIDEASELSGEFLTEMPKLVRVGEYTMKVRFTDASGNATPTLDVKMTQIYDNQPPILELPDVIVAYEGEGIAYKQHIAASDNCIGEITFEVDESQLDLSAAGEYTVYVVAVDAVGNKTKKEAVKVSVIPSGIDEEELFDGIEKLADKIIREGMSKEEMCRAVYKYVSESISYTGTSRKGDYRAEAYRALFVSAEGDCYTYFCAAKVFLEYLGIENRDVQRAEGYTSDTHYWSLVNIGEGDEARWYHFDCTRLRPDGLEHSGCLLTDKQTEAYSRARANFYRYDKSDYPAVEEEIITPTPNLEAYY